MKLALSTAMVYPRDEEDWISITRGLSFTGYEIMPQDWSEFSPDYFKRLNEKIGDKEIISIHFPLLLMGFFQNPYRKAIKTGRMIIENLVEAAAEVGAKDIVVHSSPGKGELNDEVTFNNIAYLAELGAEYGIYIDLENTKRSDCNSPAGLGKKIEQFNRENIVPMVDVTEAMESGYRPEEFLDTFSGIRHLHISDNAERPHLPLGKGDICWQDLFDSLKRNSFQGNLVLELSYRYLLDKPEEILQESLDFINKYLD